MTALKIINAVAPIRICDLGGWTDTWFAEYGQIFNIGVYPYAEVQIEVFPLKSRDERIVIFAENYGERYAISTPQTRWERHPLLEAAIDMMDVPDDLAFQITIFSEAPAGASTGTSAAVTVALIAALDRLTPGRLTPHEIARMAQEVETKRLGLQCGIQDQLCSAFGGINFIDMHAYPHATVSQIQVPNDIWWELERRLVLIYLGNSHNSSQVHEMVIRELEDAGSADSRIERLRNTARHARDAIYAGDFGAFGATMIENTAAQANLHPDLISSDAQRVIDIAKAHGAIGWKVNGAGGAGGSLTLLCGALSADKRAMLRDIAAENPLFQHIPTYLSRYGVRTWERESQ